MAPEIRLSIAKFMALNSFTQRRLSTIWKHDLNSNEGYSRIQNFILCQATLI